MIVQQVRFFIISLCTGLILRCFYDIFILWRRICKHNFIWIGIEDLVYWFFCCIFVFTLFYYENNGIIRGFLLIGIFLGMLIYHLGPSYFVVESLFRIYVVIKKILLVPAKFCKKLLQKFKNCFTLKMQRKKIKRKEQTNGYKKQTEKKSTSEDKKFATKRRKKATDIGDAVSARSICSNTNPLYFRKRKARRK